LEYTVGATLEADDPTYVWRDADDRLYKELKEGKLCCVVNSQQTGKSSLQVRTKKRLKEDGIACVVIDLSFISTQDTKEQWYLQLINQIQGDEHGLDLFINDVNQWWESQGKNLSAHDKFAKFVEQILLKREKKNIVIFIDEIQKVSSLNWNPDDFFDFIRSCHNRRGNDSRFKRLTFCLLGLASPNDLIKEKENFFLISVIQLLLDHLKQRISRHY
jgi:hypothetical protein